MAEQKRELSQLMEERDKLLALQRQMEQLHAALPGREAPAGASAPSTASASAAAPSNAGRRAPGKLAKKDAGSLALQSLRMRPPSSAAAAAASMEALTAALQQRSRTGPGAGAGAQRDSSVTTETSEAAEAVSTTSSVQAPPADRPGVSLTGRRSETVTFQVRAPAAVL